MKKLAAIVCAVSVAVMSVMPAYALSSVKLDKQIVVNLSGEQLDGTNLESAEDAIIFVPIVDDKAPLFVPEKDSEVAKFVEAFTKAETTWADAVKELNLTDEEKQVEFANGKKVALEQCKPLCDPQEVTVNAERFLELTKDVELPLPLDEEALKEKKAEDLALMVVYMDADVAFEDVKADEAGKEFSSTYPITPDPMHGAYLVLVLEA